MLTVLPMNEESATLYDRIDNRYLAEETLSVHLTNSGFSLEYQPLPEAQWRTYPPGSMYTAEQLLQRDDADCFFAFADGQPAGQAVVTKNWNYLAMLWDIRVAVPNRGQGVGRALLHACEDWAREQKLKGLVAETQISNPAACRFYQKNGFVLGGFDRLQYAAIPAQAGLPPGYRESALFFYHFFN